MPMTGDIFIYHSSFLLVAFECAVARRKTTLGQRASINVAWLGNCICFGPSSRAVMKKSACGLESTQRGGRHSGALDHTTFVCRGWLSLVNLGKAVRLPQISLFLRPSRWVPMLATDLLDDLFPPIIISCLVSVSSQRFICKRIPLVPQVLRTTKTGLCRLRRRCHYTRSPAMLQQLSSEAQECRPKRNPFSSSAQCLLQQDRTRHKQACIYYIVRCLSASVEHVELF